MKIPEKIERKILDEAIDFAMKNPEKNLPRLADLAEKIDVTGRYRKEIAGTKEFITNTDSIWYKMIIDMFHDIDPGVLKGFFRTFFVNSALISVPRQKQLEAELGVAVPWNMQIDITSACNLKCKGCWAAEYGHTESLSYEDLDSIISQGEALSTHFYIFSGGEPLMRKKDLIRICQAHPESCFMAFTNGTLIDQEFCEEMLRVQNLVLVVSIEGIGEATDFRRGKGTYEKCIKGIELLRKNKLLFGLSCVYTRQTCEQIGSDEWYDMMIGLGAKFAWFFLYMPVGNAAQPEMMVTAEQRRWMYNSVHAHRKTHGIFVLDFWNDGEYVDGCIAAGKAYLHINPAGDIEPCAFIHYSTHNIHTSTILEALKSPLFQAYRQGQPFNKNPLRPCPLLDNPDALCEIVHKSGAHSTDMQSPESVEHLTAKTRPAAEAWAPIADEIIKERYGTVCGRKTCDVCSMAHRCPDKTVSAYSQARVG